MTGFFDTLRNLGLAHQQHVQALRSALEQSDLQTARDQLADYLQVLSDTAVVGFHASLGMALAGETQPGLRQGLQWVQANVETLRAGKWRAPAPPAPHAGPGANASANASAEPFTLTQVAELITPWFNLPPEPAKAAFIQTLQNLDEAGRQTFAKHLDTMAASVQQQAQQLQDNEANAWGSSFEDRMAYAQARLQSGGPSAQSEKVAQMQTVVQTLAQMALAARVWQPEPAAAPAPSRPPAAPPTAPLHAAPTAAPTDSPFRQALAMLQQEFVQVRQERDPARAAALQSMLDRALRFIDDDEAQQPLPPDAPVEQRRAELQGRMTRLHEMREAIESMRELQRHVRTADQPTPDTRAGQIGPLLDARIDDTAGLINRPLPATRQNETERLLQLHARLVQARAQVREWAGQNEEVQRFERDTLRHTVHTLRLHQRAGHLMLARPIWPGHAARVEPGSVAVAGASAAVRAVLAPALAARLLQAREGTPPGMDVPTALWRQMQTACVAVLDLSDADPQVYYQLGQAYALGTELLLLARRGTPLPFDVEQAVLSYDDEADLATQLPAALDAALYDVQTVGRSAVMHHTLRRCSALAQQAVGVAHSTLLLQQLHDAALSPLDFAAALDVFLAQLGNSRLQVLHPRWPAFYPETSATPADHSASSQDAPPQAPRRCFVVMPFSSALTSTQAQYRALKAELQATPGLVVRGDEALGQDIVASIWEETARASHVLVDLSGYNPNVCLELGMADAMGRDTWLIGAAGTERQRFDAIDKRRIHTYGDDTESQQAVRDGVRGFLQRAPTLA